MHNLIRLIGLLLLLGWGAASGQSRLPACPATGNFVNCFGTYTSGSAKYVGEFKDNKFNGQGTFTYTDGTKYVGEWKDNIINGQGTFTYNDGGKYVGEWKHGNRDGQGTLTFPSGEKYVGEWKYGSVEGHGTEFFPNGAVKRAGIYAGGQFVRSAPMSVPVCPSSGYSQNCFFSNNGRTYVGEWQDGLPIRRGTYTWPDGDKYVGEYKDGNPNGLGTTTFGSGGQFSGDQHFGEYKDGKFNGQGVYTYSDGRTYVGEFKDFEYNGQGISSLANGSISQSGVWSGGKLVTSQYVDPNIFTRIPQGIIAPLVAEAQRKESERQAAQIAAVARRVEREREAAQLAAEAQQREAAQLVAEAQRKEKERQAAQLAAEAQRKEYERWQAESAEEKRKQCVAMAGVCRGRPDVSLRELESLSRWLRVARSEIKISRTYVETNVYSCKCWAVFSTPVGDYECRIEQNLAGVVDNIAQCTR